MNFRYFAGISKLVVISTLLVGCQSLEFGQIKNIPLSLTSTEKFFSSVVKDPETAKASEETRPLTEIINSALADQNVGEDFKTIIASALAEDPIVISHKRKVEAKLAAIASSEARKEYQVTSTLYGGIEDITDNTKGSH